MPPKIYKSSAEKRAANAKRMAEKRAAEKMVNPKPQKFSKYVPFYCFNILFFKSKHELLKFLKLQGRKC